MVRVGISSVSSGLLLVRPATGRPARAVLDVGIDAATETDVDLSYLERPRVRAFVEDAVVRFASRRPLRGDAGGTRAG